MRVSRLGLVRYGHFEDCTLEFPASEYDIHVVYGDNEAGKSTTLDALGDLLFGFGHKTDYDFRFKGPELRIAGVLEDSEETLEFIRRKGRERTIIDEDGAEIPDGERRLTSLLKGADRKTFQRLFLLNDERLKEGAQALMASSDDAGEAILAASAGIEDLHETVKGLREEADELWTPQRSKSRAYYQAKGKIESANTTKRESTVDTREWKRLERERDEARDSYEGVEEKLKAEQTEKSRLDRIQRVNRPLNQLDEVEEELKGLAETPELPEDAGSQVEEALRQIGLQKIRIDDGTKQIEKREKAMQSIQVDEALIAQKSEIDHLGERWIALKEPVEELPVKRSRYERTVAEIKRIVKCLGWGEGGDEDKLAERMPATNDIKRARKLSGEKAQLTTGRHGFDKACRRAKEKIESLEEAGREEGKPKDTKAIKAAIAVAKKAAGVVQRREKANEQLIEREQRLATALEGMQPELDSIEALKACLAPDTEAVSQYRDRERELREELEAKRGRLSELEAQISELKRRIEGVKEEAGVPDEEGLEEARRQRDEAWALIEKRYVERAEPGPDAWKGVFGEDEAGTTRYRELIEAADRVADERFENAEAIAAIGVSVREIKRLCEERESTEREIKAAKSAKKRFEKDWVLLWERSGVMPGSAEVGLRWMGQYEKCQTMLEESEKAKTELEHAAQEEEKEKAALRNALKAFFGEKEIDKSQSLNALIEIAEENVREAESAREEAKAREESIREAKAELREAEAELGAHADEEASWKTSWTEAMVSLGLEEETDPESIEGALEDIEGLGKAIEEAIRLRDEEIGSVETGAKTLEESVARVAEALDRKIGDKDQMTWLQELQAKLREAERAKERRDQLETEIAEVKDAIEALRSEEKEQRALVDRLMKEAKVSSEDDLKDAIRDSDRKRELESRLEELRADIITSGDGIAVEELREQRTGVDIDEAAARSEELAGSIKALVEERDEKRDELIAAEQKLESVGSKGEAAKAEFRRQAAIAEMREVAERYVRVEAMSALLEWSIEQFRSRHQKPLIEKASELVAIMTRGSLERVMIEYDGDEPVLAARRGNGEVLRISGLSSGTEDQLYLALRLAAVEEYAKRRGGMPFIGDDLFLRFDHKRAEKTLTALLEVSRRQQVILFTHDEGFLGVARRGLGERMNEVHLDPQR